MPRRHLARSSQLGLIAGLYLLTRIAGLAQTLSQNFDWQAPLPFIALLNVQTSLRARVSSRLPVEFAVLRGPTLMEGTQLVATNVGSVLVERGNPALLGTFQYLRRRPADGCPVLLGYHTFAIDDTKGAGVIARIQRTILDR